VGLETRIFENLMVRFSRTRPTGQRGPPLEMNHFSGKFPPGPHCSIYVSTEISGNFGITESTLCLNYILIEPHFIILTKCIISTVNTRLADTLLLWKPYYYGREPQPQRKLRTTAVLKTTPTIRTFSITDSKSSSRWCLL